MPLAQILKDVWRWTWFSQDKGMNFNGYALRLGREFVLIDPAYDDAAVWEEFSILGPPTAVLLTNKDHERASHEVRGRFGIPVAIHAADAPLLEVPPERVFEDGAGPAIGLRAVRFRRLKSPGECAFLWTERRVLIVGDAVTGHPAGALGLVKKHQGSPAVVSELREVLLPLDFDVLLMGDGEPVLSGAKKLLEGFLSGAASPVT